MTIDKDKLRAQWLIERANRLVYADPITGAEDAWHIDLLVGWRATFIFENEVHEGPIDQMENKLFDLVIAHHENGERESKERFGIFEDVCDDIVGAGHHDDACPAQNGLRCACGAAGRGENA